MPTTSSVRDLQPIRKRAGIKTARVDLGGKLRAASALAALALCPALSGCILGSERPELNLDMSASYRAAPKGDADAAVPVLDWWRGFRSGELTSLMEAAQIYNLDIAVAIAQIVQADAQVGVSGAPLLPTLTGNASAERQKQSSANTISSGQGFGGATFNTFQTGLTASYMLDFWGKNRATLYAAEENATVSRYNREVVTLTTEATVANTYFQILAAQEEIRVTRQNLAAAERILAVIKNQFNGGTASQLDLSQQEAVVATQRAAIPPLEVTLGQNIAAMAVLVARAPANFTVHGGSTGQITIPRVTPGLPSELLYQRPDIREAEALLASSNFSVEAARAAFFPQIQLTDRKSTRLNSSHTVISYAVFCLKKKTATDAAGTAADRRHRLGTHRRSSRSSVHASGAHVPTDRARHRAFNRAWSDASLQETYTR